MGLLTPDEEKSNQEMMQYILYDGFTTAESVSQIAGRGVGLDIVNNEIKQLGGSLTISSEPNRGTLFSVRLPLTLAINQALLVTVSEDIYAIPLTAIEGVALLTRQEVEENLTGKRKDYEYAGNTYDMHYLGTLMGMGLPAALAPEGRFPLLLMRAGGRRIGVHMESMLGRREIVVKPVGPQITAVPGISGATILADGRVVLILDIAGLVGGGKAELTYEPEHTTLPFDKPDDELTVMVVDDSITIRKVTARILSRHGLKVITAKDGLDAVQQCQDVTPDLFLMDIEMPRMDGFELATHVRSDVRLQGIPIIMITSRTGEKHRDRAREIGVDKYLGKPFQEAELMLEINTLLDREATA
jgi:chemosensory pili system protein ChpA (sensor histidine kinase/response regulator)